MARSPDTQYTTVTMDDGRTVEFAGKRKMLKTPLFNEDGTVTVRLDFVNGESRYHTPHPDLIKNFIAHGIEQKLGDEISGVDDIEDCILAIDALLERLEQGTWGIKRESNGVAGVSVLAKALVEVSGKPIAVIKEFLMKRTHGEKMALRADPAIKAVLERLEADKVSKKNNVDTAALLNGLNDIGDEADEE